MKPSIWTSRKFWLAIADAVFSIGGLLLTNFMSPEDLKMAMLVVAYLQPVILAVIVSYTVENVAALNNQM